MAWYGITVCSILHSVLRDNAVSMSLIVGLPEGVQFTPGSPIDFNSRVALTSVIDPQLLLLWKLSVWACLGVNPLDMPRTPYQMSGGNHPTGWGDFLHSSGTLTSSYVHK